VETLREALPQKSEQFFPGPELQSIAGLQFFHGPFKLPSCGVCLKSESHDKRSSHIGSVGCFRNQGVLFSLNLRDVYPLSPLPRGLLFPEYSVPDAASAVRQGGNFMPAR
jgi:hypothetical protein